MPFVQTQNIQFSSQCCILFAENATLLISETCYIHFPKFAGVKLLTKVSHLENPFIKRLSQRDAHL